MRRDDNHFRNFWRGKTTVGQLLARELHWRFIEADDFHPGAAKYRKERKRHPLTDEDRWPGWTFCANKSAIT
jgi:gluconate kinase